MNDESVWRLGLVVNPFAGLGGTRAYKGSDLPELQAQALSQGWHLPALARTEDFLRQLSAEVRAQLVWRAPMGIMGGDALAAAGIAHEALPLAYPSARTPTDARHTAEAVASVCAAGVDLLLFVGGDGTARDVLEALPPCQPALGVPAGVKMQSGVFAVSPSHAAGIIRELVEGQLVRLVEAEVRDIDEQALRAGRLKSHYFGAMCTLQSPEYIQHTKQGGVEQEDLVILDIAEHLRPMVEATDLLIVGPGSTTAGLMQNWGLKASLLGVDVVARGVLVAADVDAEQLQQWVDNTQGTVRLLVTVMGGQGILFGRGNQQITPGLLRRIGKQNLTVVATKTKIKSLEGRPLRIDSGERALDLHFAGALPIVTGFAEHVFYPVV